MSMSIQFTSSSPTFYIFFNNIFNNVFFWGVHNVMYRLVFVVVTPAAALKSQDFQLFQFLSGLVNSIFRTRECS